MPAQTGKLLVQVLRKIPIFKGLSPSQVKKILGLCTHKSYEAGSVVCRSNSPSDEMYILLTGELVVVTAEGVRVATILPVTTVGEMGVITGQPRSATVEVSRPSTIFAVKKRSFDAMLRDDSEMRATVYKNIIDVLSDKLNNDNVRLRDYEMEKARCQMRLQALGRQLEEQRLRTEAAIDMAAARGDHSREEIAMHVEEQVRDLVTHILVVDDEDDGRRLLAEALAAYDVVEARNGRQALELVREQRIDLVLTDIRMPEMDGMALLRELRRAHPELPVVAVSGYLEAGDAAACDFDGFMEKPLDLSALRDLVAARLEQRRSAG